MNLRHSPDLHRLLQDVCDERVVHHSGTCDAWESGWSWSSGGHMSQADQSLVDELRHAALVTFQAPSKPCGNKVLLTFAGSERLAEWSARFPVRSEATGGAA